MNLDKAVKRDKMRRKKKHGMKVDGKSVFIIHKIILNKSKEK